MEVDDDINVGFWIDEQPYEFEKGSKMEESSRYYLRDIPQLPKLRCSTWAGGYFESFPDIVTESKTVPTISYKPKGPVFRNGRYDHAYNLDLNPKKFSIVQPIPKELRSPLAVEFDDFKGPFDMSELICSTLKERDMSMMDLMEMIKRCPPLSKCDPCTKIGYKMAKSLIRVAATRIFADPEQSIIELPVNSIDAYNPESKIGKFGMGFFSILYWLIGHPDRILNITSYTKDNQNKYLTYNSKIQEIDGALTFTLKTYPLSEVTRTGTRIILEAKDNPFSDVEFNGFFNQITKLDYVEGVNLILFCNGKPERTAKTKFKRSWEKLIVIHLNYDSILVEDYATGIPFEVLLGSLFIPSISTKTIKMSEASGDGEIVASVIPGSSISKFIITVSDIVVVSFSSVTPSSFSEVYRISMPKNTRLPVSRDDIILTESNREGFRRAISKLLLGAKDLSHLQLCLDKYMIYTADNIIKDVISSAMNEYYISNRTFLVPKIYISLYKTIALGKSQYLKPTIPPITYIPSDVYYPIHIEEWLDLNIKHDVIWQGKKVVYHTDPIFTSPTTGMLPNYIFVNSSYTKDKNWIANLTNSFVESRLIPISSKLAIKDYNELLEKTHTFGTTLDYDKLYKTSKTRNSERYIIGTISDFIGDEKLRDGLYSLIMKMEGLDIYFDIIEFYQLVNIILEPYIYLGPRYEKILTAYFTRFSTFTGNQTYGGSKFKLIPFDYSIEVNSDTFSEKDQQFLMENAYCSILAINEQDHTRLCNFNINNHITLKKTYSKTGIARDFYNIAFEISNNLVELTLLKMAVGEAIINMTFIPQIPYSSLKEYIQDVLKRIRAVRLGIKDLIYLYTRASNNLLTRRFSYVFIMKEYTRTKSWLSSFSPVNMHVIPNMIPQIKNECSLSSMISSLFRSLPTNDNELIKLVNDASKKKPLPLQTIEIAINEGTTKPFIEAVLTELIQNSIDASREFSISDNISIGLSKVSDRNELCLSIEDYIGMNMEAFLYIGIPFLSTKTASSLVTGEMGSGFFNVYRESSTVVIKSTKDTIRRIWVDIPVRDEKGRVVDIIKRCSIDKSETKNSTIIDIYIPYKDENDKIEKIGAVNYTVHRILSQATYPSNLLLNGVSVNINKTLYLSMENFDIYITHDDYPSYLLTKGIPFALLQPYINTLLPRVLCGNNGVVIDIKHGGYTPVQTRTRINMPPAIKKEFETAIIYAMYIYILNGRGLWGDIPNYYSKESVSQLRFGVGKGKPTTETDILLYTDFKYKNKVMPKMAVLLNEAMSIMGNKKFADVTSDIDRMFSKYTTGNPTLDFLIKQSASSWLSTKNSKVEETVVLTVTKEIEYKRDRVDKITAKIFTAWYGELWKYWSMIKVTRKNLKNPIIDVIRSEEPISGIYEISKNTIVININNIQIGDIIEVVAKIKSADISDLQSTLFKPLKNNRLWTRYFSYGFPACTLIHEAEHYRRSTPHNDYHTETNDLLYAGDTVKQRSFDQGANAIYQKCIEVGFWSSFIKVFKQ